KAASRPIAVSAPAVPFVVDWDNDDKKDLLVGAGNGRVLYFHNTGTEFDPALAAGTPIQAGGADFVAPGGNASPWVVDWDGDGRKDLLVGAGDGSLWLLLNVGADAAPVFASASPVELTPSTVRKRTAYDVGADAAPAPFDVNRDGLFELVTGSSGGDVS